MKHPKWLIFFTGLLLIGCSDHNEFSPNQVSDDDSAVALNATNVAQLQSAPLDDTITIAFIGDSQNFYNEVEPFVQKVNDISAIDFVLIAGDISDYGLLQEFEWISERLTSLSVPYIGVIGNHDLVANGEQVYKRMFGALNFSFVYDSVKFIVHNTNGREYRHANVPDTVWLKKELAVGNGVKNFIAVSHVPPFSGDFNPTVEKSYRKMFASAPGFIVSLHGHIHRHTDGYPYEDGIRYITSHSFEQRSFVLLKISGKTVSKQIIDY
jgi:predicted phosphodiesterase